MVVTFTLQSIYSGQTYVAGPFNISGTTSNNNTTELATGLTKNDLLTGYTISNINDLTTGGTIASTGVCTNTIQWTTGILPAPTISLAIYGKDLKSTPGNVTLFYKINSGSNINVPGYTNAPLPSSCSQLYTITGLTSGDTVTLGTSTSCKLSGTNDSSTCPSSVGGSTTHTTTINGTAPTTDLVAIAINSGEF